jgi:hypothetical protein
MALMSIKLASERSDFLWAAVMFGAFGAVLLALAPKRTSASLSESASSL